jgi:hypothetical protein
MLNLVQNDARKNESMSIVDDIHGTQLRSERTRYGANKDVGIEGESQARLPRVSANASSTSASTSSSGNTLSERADLASLRNDFAP